MHGGACSVAVKRLVVVAAIEGESGIRVWDGQNDAKNSVAPQEFLLLVAQAQEQGGCDQVGACWRGAQDRQGRGVHGGALHHHTTCIPAEAMLD